MRTVLIPLQWDLLVPRLLGDRDNETGVGLGLALSRGLTEAMGGSLRPDSTPGGGLTIVLALPASETAEEPREEGSAPLRDFAGGARVSRLPLSEGDAK